jgi:hypothetical protein
MTEKPEPNPEWEALADAAHAAIVAEVGEPNPFDTLTMLEKWKADAEPANSLGQVSFSRAMLDSAEDALRVALSIARTEYLGGKTAYLRGLQDMREMLARFVEQGGDAEAAASMRANWNPEWGEDPGQPNPCGILQGGYLGPALAAKVAALKAEKFPPPDARAIMALIANADANTMGGGRG